MKTKVENDYYKILGVNPNASLDELKTAYRKQALATHPDKNIGHELEAEAKFLKVQSAYEILKDPQKRTIYDQGQGQGENVLEPDRSTFETYVASFTKILDLYDKQLDEETDLFFINNRAYL